MAQSTFLELDPLLKMLAKNPELLVVNTLNRDTAGALTGAPVGWPDGTNGTYTALVVSTTFPGSVDSYKITRVVGGVTTTYTQPTVTRRADGAITALPGIVVT